jgi:hypothetical protein
MPIPAQPAAAQRNFQIFYDANHLYMMKKALTRKNKNNHTTPNTNYL